MHFISNGDFLFPFTWPFYFQQHLFTWSFQKGAANPDGVVRLPGRVLDLLVFYVSNNVVFGYFYILSTLLIIAFVFFVFCRHFLEIRDRTICIVSALFFAVNPIFLVNLTKIGLVLAAGLLPLCLVVLRLGFERKQMRYFMLWLILANISLLHPYTFIINLFVSVAYIAFSLTQQTNRYFLRNNYMTVIAIVVFSILLNAYFILPQASLKTLDKGSLTNNISSSPVDYTALVDISNTGNILTALSLSRNVLKDFEFYNNWYSPVFFAGIFLLYGLMFGIYLKYAQKIGPKDKQRIYVALLLFLVLILLATVTFLNVDVLIKTLIRLPGGWAFRSPLKWQLYTPIVLMTILAVTLKYVRKGRDSNIVMLCLLAAFVAMNGYLFRDIGVRMLQPKTVSTLSSLQNTDLTNKTLLIVNSQECVGYANTHTQVLTEMNQILISKYVQVKQIGYNDISKINIGTYDYVIGCQSNMESLLHRNYNFSLRNQLSENSFQLYENQRSNPLIYSVSRLYQVDKDSNNINNKYDLATNILKTNFDFIEEFQKDVPAVPLQGLFENYGSNSLAAGKLTDTVSLIDRSNQNRYLYSAQNVYIAITNSELKISPVNKPGYKFVKKYEPIVLPASVGQEVKTTYEDGKYTFKNLIRNPGLENGLWQKRVGDCYNHNGTASIKMTLQRDGNNNFLQLASKRHLACTNPPEVSVIPGQHYLFTLKYSSATKHGAGFHIGFNNQSASSLDTVLTATKDSWSTYSEDILIPQGVTKLKVVLYAYPDTTGLSGSLVKYDNIGVTAVPNINSNFFITNAVVRTSNPEVTFKVINPTKYTVAVKGAITPFILIDKDTYNSSWRLSRSVQRTSLSTLFTGTSLHSGFEHFKVNGTSNGWAIDPVKFCSKNTTSCTKNFDGSYDINMNIEFAAQRYFYIGVLISALTVIVIISWGFISYQNTVRRTYVVKDRK